MDEKESFLRNPLSTFEYWSFSFYAQIKRQRHTQKAGLNFLSRLHFVVCERVDEDPFPKSLWKTSIEPWKQIKEQFFPSPTKRITRRRNKSRWVYVSYIFIYTPTSVMQLNKQGEISRECFIRRMKLARN